MMYVLQIQAGKEYEVCAALKRDNITAYAPGERIIIRKGGLWSKMLKLLFPGYVFVDIDYNAKVYHRINPVSGVIRFLGEPTPLPKDEEEMILWLANNGNVIEPSTAIIDENGNITDFEGFLGGCQSRIRYINKRQKKASVIVTFGGKQHKANIAFDLPTTL